MPNVNTNSVVEKLFGGNQNTVAISLKQFSARKKTRCLVWFCRVSNRNSDVIVNIIVSIITFGQKRSSWFMKLMFVVFKLFFLYEGGVYGSVKLITSNNYVGYNSEITLPLTRS